MSISKVGTYTFYAHPSLERAVVSAPVIEQGAFYGATKLEAVDLTSTAADTINADAFNGCSNLTHLVVRSSTRSALSATSALNNTKIKNGEGGIYVPADLLDSYKGATNWSAFAKNIYPIGEYPRENFDSISDSWSDIFANSDYATAYAVKDTKTLELTDGTKIKMDLAAFNTDDKSNNSGKAKITWISHYVPFMHAMNTTNTITGGWANMELRNWLNIDIFSLIPETIKNHIVAVNKTYRSLTPTDETLISSDYLWVPSVYEVASTDNSGLYNESSGVLYSDIFPITGSYSNKISARVRSGNRWWLRTAYNSTSFLIIDTSGVLGTGFIPTHASVGVVFGFCTD